MNTHEYISERCHVMIGATKRMLKDWRNRNGRGRSTLSQGQSLFFFLIFEFRFNIHTVECTQLSGQLGEFLHMYSPVQVSPRSRSGTFPAIWFMYFFFHKWYCVIYLIIYLNFFSKGAILRFIHTVTFIVVSNLCTALHEVHPPYFTYLLPQ